MSQEPLLSSVICHRKTGQGPSCAKSLCYLQSYATERLDKDLHEPRASVILSNIRCHRKTGQGLSQAKSLCYLQYCMCSMFCFVIQLLSEPDKQDCWPDDFKV
ncbi:uncharacterized protein [Porites lutea]|uniref:uncharacterized protein n=1 Tax=Porites lutea TaxID=51062 RepID=UPI003CC63ACD